MSVWQIIFLLLLSAFYITYFVKMFMLKKQGIKGNLLGKDNKPKSAIIFDMILSVVTFLGGMIQFGSTIYPKLIWSAPTNPPVMIIGAALACLGVLFFITAIITMKNNWRAGFNSKQNTRLVTDGIYKYSRNPAFVGFDLIYISCVLTFPNVINIAIALMAVIIFHIQILREEKYLVTTFDQEYKDYKAKTGRYLIIL